ncbi:MAG: hypothetical protein HQ596_08665 [Candidatus Saganbacteria bacterium]|nr:hypothetical protein [Candidatus Saganbacteria bacterium]
MFNLKLIAFNMRESVEGIPSAKELVEILGGEISEEGYPALIDQLRLFGLPLVKRNLKRMLEAGEQAKLIKYLGGPDPKGIMIKLRETRLGNDFISNLLGQGDEASKKAVVWWLGEMGNWDDLMPLDNLVGENQDELGDIAAQAIVKIESSRNTKLNLARRYLANIKASLRFFAATILAEEGTSEDLEGLRQQLRDELGMDKTLTRVVIGEAIAQITFREQRIAAVRTMLEDPYEEIAAGAATVLGEHGDRAIVRRTGGDIRLLAQSLERKSRMPPSRYCPEFAQAVVTLTEKGGGLGKVRGLLVNSNVHIRKAAAEMIEKKGEVMDIARLGLILTGASPEQDRGVKEAISRAIVTILERQRPTVLDQVLVDNKATISYLLSEEAPEDARIAIAKIISEREAIAYRQDFWSVIDPDLDPSLENHAELLRIAGEGIARTHAKEFGLGTWGEESLGTPGDRAVGARGLFGALTDDANQSYVRDGLVKVLGERGEQDDLAFLRLHLESLGPPSPTDLLKEARKLIAAEAIVRITYRTEGFDGVRPILTTAGEGTTPLRQAAANLLGEESGLDDLPLLERTVQNVAIREIDRAMNRALFRICQREERLDELVAILERTKRPNIIRAFMLEYADV